MMMMMMMIVSSGGSLGHSWSASLVFWDADDQCHQFWRELGQSICKSCFLRQWWLSVLEGAWTVSLLNGVFWDNSGV
jgi:hypothetical protein